ncbi:uncharacterized protein LOC132937018 [Metopolophium dirhodum]|uniref:uncharacterized protein LOC132937018 n=1 Tax=Metopolophium dirhodum TaxID=44670 RepID=UPI00299079D2|nr:uncharacterized protein LOC132937018 [Metopolophium dirhodum]
MAKPKKNKDINYARRLKELKEKLKPYRNRETVNLLRVITGSSGTLLHNHWESLESVLTGEYSLHDVKQKIQSVANMILENGEFVSKSDRSNSIEHSMVSKECIQLHVDSKANISDNVTHGNINSNSNVVENTSVINRLRHLHIESCNPECYNKL